jgi:lysozyme
MTEGKKFILFGVLIGSSYLIYRKFFRRMISQKGIEFLTEAEGFKTKAYPDIKGLMTIGVGHLIDLVKETHLLTKVLTKKEVQDIFNKDLDRFEAVVKNTIKVPISQAQRDSLIALSFNIGESGFKNSTLAKMINAKASKEEIRKSFAAWNKPAALKSRRAKEIRLFLTGNYSPVISSAEVQKYMS